MSTNKRGIFLWCLVMGVIIVFSQSEVARADYYYDYSSPYVDIPEGSWVYDKIDVSGVPSNAKITSVEVYFSVTHDSPTDIKVDLEHPQGSKYRIWEAISSDNYRPTSYWEPNITKFNGLGVNGTWRDCEWVIFIRRIKEHLIPGVLLFTTLPHNPISRLPIFGLNLLL